MKTGDLTSLEILAPGETRSISTEEQVVELAPGKSDGDADSDTTDQSDITYAVHRVNDDDGSSATRFTAVVEQATDTPTWAFDEDAVLTELDDGRVTISNDNGDFLGGIEAPWAVDAEGDSIPTRYEVHDNVLTQTLDTDENTAFPVVADPTVKVYPGYIKVRLNKSESWSAVGTVGTCVAVFSKSPHPLGKALHVGCGVISAISAAKLSGGKCITVHVVGVAPPLGTWWPTFPKCKK